MTDIKKEADGMVEKFTRYVAGEAASKKCAIIHCELTITYLDKERLYNYAVHYQQVLDYLKNEM